jgi:hypothetical protein
MLRDNLPELPGRRGAAPLRGRTGDGMNTIPENARTETSAFRWAGRLFLLLALMIPFVPRALA